MIPERAALSRSGYSLRGGAMPRLLLSSPGFLSLAADDLLKLSDAAPGHPHLLDFPALSLSTFRARRFLVVFFSHGLL